MTNKDRYQRAFSTLHASDKIMEVTTMKKASKKYIPKAVVVCAVVIMLLTMAAAAYAADVGGIQRTVQIWIQGDQTDAVLEIQQGDSTSYTVTYEDEDGNEHEMSGGGIAIDLFGQERPLTEKEILEHLDSPEVQYQEDGSIWVYYRSHKLDITDKFEDEICHVHLIDGNDNLYVTISPDGVATSPHGYVDP